MRPGAGENIDRASSGEVQSAGRHSVAVIPIVPEDDENDRELAALGNLLQERTLLEAQNRSLGRSPVLSKLAVDGLRGSSRTIQAVRALGPAYWMEAALHRIETGVRLHVKVVRAHDLRILWVGELDYPVQTFLTYRDRFATELAERLLGATVARPEWPIPITSDNADLVRAAAVFLEKGGALPAIERLDRVLAAEPSNTIARGVLARALAAAWTSGAQPDTPTAERARAEAEAVLRESPNDVNALGALGAIQMWLDRNPDAAGISLRKAVATGMAAHDVRRWHNAWLSETGRHDEAIADARRLYAIAPISNGPLLARALTLAGREGAETYTLR